MDNPYGGQLLALSNLLQQAEVSGADEVRVLFQ